MVITVLISVTDHMVIAGIFIYLFPLHILCPLYPQQAPQMIVVFYMG